MNTPILETERLILRRPQESDFLEELDFWQSERCEHVGGKKNRDEVWRAMAMLIGHWEIRGFGFFAVLDRASEEYFGRVGHWFPEGWPEPEIGWTITSESAEGKGIAYEAAIASREHAYKELGWDTAISLIDPENTRSVALGKRMGAKFEASIDNKIYGKMHIHRHPSKERLS